MRRSLSIMLIMLLSGGFVGIAGKGTDETQRRSDNRSYPQPFETANDNPVRDPAITTGYYIVDSEDNAGSKWTPNYALLFQSLDFEPATWRRIHSGPGQFPQEFWDTNPDGRNYFRNPDDMNDSTDNALAGPITIGFPFYFNGVRYDSFYVSSNGLISLSNRRYFYDKDGNRTIPQGQTTAYDPNSDDTRPRTDPTGLDDTTPDNYGYRFIALGDTDSPTGGIRSFSNSIGMEEFSDDASSNGPILAPLWDDMHLSQFNNQTNQAEDYGQVYFKRSINNSQLRIYFVRLQPIGRKSTPVGNTTFQKDHRPGVDRSMEVSLQVVLDRRDSSVTYLYQVFQPPVVIVNNLPVPPTTIMRYNATVGLRGQARYLDPENFEERRYLQYTEYFRDNAVFTKGAAGSQFTTPGNNLAVKFKQWKNVLRVVDIKYLIRDPDSGEFSKEVKNPDNYEMLVGHRSLGAIQPVARFQNLTNDIQGTEGVNFQPQDLEFRTRFRIRNDILNDTTIYNRQVCVDSFSLANSDVSGVRLVDWEGNALEFDGHNGLPPYGFVEVKFQPFYTHEFISTHQGRLTSYVIAEPYECRGREGYNDCWPFDDTTTARLFGIKVLKNFRDHVGDFSFSMRDGTLPSVNKWVSIGAEAVNGDANCYNPPPPRGQFRASNDTNITLHSPVIRMNRIDLDGTDLSRGGDQLISFPIDLRGRKKAVLALSYQRTGRPPTNGFPRGWSDQTLFGPEPRVFRRGDTSAVQAEEDRLEVHFANPSPNQYDNITNIPTNGYSKHPRIDDPDEFISGNPAYTIFGAGGWRRGFSKENKNEALTFREGLRSKYWDDGKDWEFNKIYIPIPDYILKAPEDGARYFRFKIEVDAANHSRPASPVDDDDNFYVDNVNILFPTETPDLEVSLVKAKWPYTQVPASQAQEIPIIVKVANNSDFSSRSFSVHTFIKEEGAPDSLVVYCRTKTIPFLPGNREVEQSFPNWDGRRTRPGNYRLTSYIYGVSDPIPNNNLTYGEFELNFGDSFAYEPVDPEQGMNDVPEFARKNGKGLNLEGYSSGSGNNPYPFGADGGNSSGQFAMKFELTRQDTIHGFKAYFGSLNSDILNISFAVYQNAGGSPGRKIHSTEVFKKRGQDDISGEIAYDQYTTYLLNRAIILPPDVYWVAVAQRGTEGYELGGSASRMGMVTTHYHDQPVLGVSGQSMVIDKNFRERNIAGELINSNFFAYENTLGSGVWNQMTPTVGNPGYAHLGHTGQRVNYRTYSRGSWIPMIRPYFGERSYADPPRYLPCVFFPVELVEFDGEALPPMGIELFWETASETNNAGFHVERRLSASTDDFRSVGFVKGAGNSGQPVNYRHLDVDVERGQEYEYRLRQVDLDGTVTYSRSITLRYDINEGLSLSNAPNPVKDKTDINFSVPDNSTATLQVLDMFGNTVITIIDKETFAVGEQTVAWNGRDAKGTSVASGVYILSLQANGKTVTRTINVLR